MAEPNFGTDFSGILDIDAAWTVTSGYRLLAEALAGRLVTQAGTMPGDADYGYDLRQHLNAPVFDASRIAARVRTELLKDERVSEVTVSVSLNAKTQVITCDIAVEPAVETAGRPFSFRIAIDEVSADVLNLKLAA